MRCTRITLFLNRSLAQGVFYTVPRSAPPRNNSKALWITMATNSDRQCLKGSDPISKRSKVGHGCVWSRKTKLLNSNGPIVVAR